MVTLASPAEIAAMRDHHANGANAPATRLLPGRIVARSALALALVTGAACNRSEITLPDTYTTGQLTVDASTAWAYVDLTTGAVVPQTSAATSTTWDIGFSATS